MFKLSLEQIVIQILSHIFLIAQVFFILDVEMLSNELPEWNNLSTQIVIS